MRHHFIKQEFEKGLFKLEHVPSIENPADMLTKPLSGPKLVGLIERAGLGPISLNKSKTLSLLLVLLNLASIAQAWSFRKVEPIIWAPTEHYVDLGAGLHSIEYRFQHSCGILTSALEDKLTKAKYGYVNKSSDRFYQLCKNEIEEHWLNNLNRLPSCDEEQEGYLRLIHSRSKRALFFVILAIVATVLVLTRRMDLPLLPTSM